MFTMLDIESGSAIVCIEPKLVQAKSRYEIQSTDIGS